MTTEEDERFYGYLDGRDPLSPEPSGNRSHSYRHSFAVGRREINGDYSVGYAAAMEQARQAEELDRAW